MNKRQLQAIYSDMTGPQINRRNRLFSEGWRAYTRYGGAVVVRNDITGEHYTGRLRTLKNGELSRRVDWD